MQGKFTELLKRLRANDLTLTDINLWDNDIRDEGIKDIVEALKDNRVLGRISLGKNNISNVGAKEIAGLIKVNPTLADINLWENNIGDPGTKEIAKALKVNRTLYSIDLGSNNITDVGATDIAEALETNQTLSFIDLWGNKISIALKGRIGALCGKNAELRNGLIKAIEKGDLLEVKAKLKAGVSVFACDFKGDNLLHLATTHNQLEIAEYLLSEIGKYRSDPLSSKNYDAKTPLMLAEAKKNDAMTVLLQEQGEQWISEQLEKILAFSTQTKIFARAKYDYEPESSEELGFKQGDKLTILTITESGWWEAELNNRIGKVPASFIEIEKSLELEPKLVKPANAKVHQTGKKEAKPMLTKPIVPTKKVSKTTVKLPNRKAIPIKGMQAIPALALYDYTAQRSNELSFKKGDSLSILEQPFGGWWPAKLHNQQGEVPSNYLQLETLPPIPKSKPMSDKFGIDITRLNYRDLEFIKYESKCVILGQGAFGVVYKGTYHGNTVAIKQLTQDPNEQILEELFNEVSVMQSVDSPYTVHCYGMTIAPYALVMACMAGDLYNLLHNPENSIDWMFCYKLCQEISSGIAYLHEKDIVHGDLKSPNVLLDEKGQAKIADFGSSKIRVFTLDIAATLFGKKVGGSYNYIAPELLQELKIVKVPDIASTHGNKEIITGFSPGAKTTKASDIYSLGILLGEITTRQVPFWEQLRGKNKVSLIQFKQLICEQGMYPDHNSNTLPRLKGIIQHCWFKAPQKRPPVLEVLSEIKAEASTLTPEFGNTLIPKLT
jgi:hypothetical protein